MNRQKVEEIKKRRYKMNKKNSLQRISIERHVALIPEQLRSSRKDRITLKCLPSGYKASKLVHNDNIISQNPLQIVSSTPNLANSESIDRVLKEAITIISGWMFDEPAFIDASVYGDGNSRCIDQVNERLKVFKAGISSSVMEILESATIHCRKSAKATPKAIKVLNSSIRQPETPRNAYVLKNLNELGKRRTPIMLHPLRDIQQNKDMNFNDFSGNSQRPFFYLPTSNSTNILCSASSIRKGEITLTNDELYQFSKEKNQKYSDCVSNFDNIRNNHDTAIFFKENNRKRFSECLFNGSVNSTESVCSYHEKQKMCREERNEKDENRHTNAVKVNCDTLVEKYDYQRHKNLEIHTFQQPYIRESILENCQSYHDDEEEILRKRNNIKQIVSVGSKNVETFASSLIRHPIWDTPEALKTSSTFLFLEY